MPTTMSTLPEVSPGDIRKALLEEPPDGFVACKGEDVLPGDVLFACRDGLHVITELPERPRFGGECCPAHARWAIAEGWRHTVIDGREYWVDEQTHLRLAEAAEGAADE